MYSFGVRHTQLSSLLEATSTRSKQLGNEETGLDSSGHGAAFSRLPEAKRLAFPNAEPPEDERKSGRQAASSAGLLWMEDQERPVMRGRAHEPWLSPELAHSSSVVICKPPYQLGPRVASTARAPI